jgi:putative transposase
MGDTFLIEEVPTMPWEGVTVSEQRRNFIRDYVEGMYSKAELAQTFGISRKTAYKWIARFRVEGDPGLEERSRRPHSCPWQTEASVAREIISLRKARPRRGPKKLFKDLQRRHRGKDLPAISTIAHILSREGLAKKPRRHRRAHPGCPKSVATGPNDIWAADYKGQFRLKNGQYCFPLTVSDLFSRYLLGCEAHPAVSLQRTLRYFIWLFHTYGLPNRIRTDNGVPFASSALARLSHLSAWWIKLGIYPELIEPGKPQQNGIHERMHRTLKQEATIPPANSLHAQQRKFDSFRLEFNTDRPHEALQMACPAEVYRASASGLPPRMAAYEYPRHFLVRRVSRCGTIRVLHNQIFVSQVLNEDYVGLEEVDDGLFDLYFCFYLLGRYELRTNRIRDIISRVPTSNSRAEGPNRVSPMSLE